MTRHPVDTEASADVEPVAIACNLAPSAQHHQLAEWTDLLSVAIGRSPIDGGRRVTFPAEPALIARLADLAVREHQCCPFLTFTLTIADTHYIELNIHAPVDAIAMLQDLFGP